MSNDRIVQANGVELCVETFGNPADPALLLIGGAASSMDWWEDEFCVRLAAGPRFVLRYDHRDTGRSVSYEPGAPPYTVRDLSADVVGLLDAFGLERAHLVGISMGGGIAQLLALDHPNRVASLTLISTSPGGPDGGPANPDLPPMSEELRAVFAEPGPQPDWSDRAAVIEYIVDGARPFAGSLPFGEAGLREIAARVFDRTLNIASSMTNHWILEGGGDPLRPRLGAIVAPTLVMHGTADPLFPYGHAVAPGQSRPAHGAPEKSLSRRRSPEAAQSLPEGGRERGRHAGIGHRAPIALLRNLGTTQPCAPVGIQFIEPPDT